MYVYRNLKLCVSICAFPISGFILYYYSRCQYGEWKGSERQSNGARPGKGEPRVRARFQQLHLCSITVVRPAAPYPVLSRISELLTIFPTIFSTFSMHSVRVHIHLFQTSFPLTQAFRGTQDGLKPPHHSRKVSS